MAYLRARRSIKLAPGFRVNLNKRSVGLTVGPRGAHYSVNTAGRRQSSVGIPGSGLSWIDVHGGRRARSSTSRSKAAAPRGFAAPPSGPAFKSYAGLLASHHERAYAKALRRLRSGKKQEAIAILDEAISSDKREAAAAHLVAGMTHFLDGDYAGAIPNFESVVRTHGFINEDPLFEKYEIPNGYYLTDAPIGDVTAPGGVDALGPIYVLASCYSQTGRLDDAIGVLQKVAETQSDGHGLPPFVLLALCGLYARAQEWDEIVHIGRYFEVSNTDDVTLGIRICQAGAMEALGMWDAAIEVYRDCLRSSKRDAALLKAARYNRALAYLHLGKKAYAKRDLSRIYAEDPSYAETEQLLRELG
jgi:tetratricopeptide (TPR) repeat protein